MSLAATRWAWQQRVTPAQKLVLLSLADRAGEAMNGKSTRSSEYPINQMAKINNQGGAFL